MTEFTPAKRIGKAGFTLIELSLVLVIIGLIVGGVLVGQDLISAAAIRAQISQIEKYNTAVNVFRAKYGYLPGDIPNPYASQFGFRSRGTQPGQGDGDGRLAGDWSGEFYGGAACGETDLFWVDLSTANLIDGGFSTASVTPCPMADVTGADIDRYYPKAKLGNGLYVYIASDIQDNWYYSYWNSSPYLRDNAFVISALTGIGFASNHNSNYGGKGISVRYAYSIDKKIDDGFPISGKVLAAGIIGQYNGNILWANGDINLNTDPNPPTNYNTAPSVTTCYDNNSNVANPTQYSIGVNGGNGQNCALSFKFQ